MLTATFSSPALLIISLACVIVYLKAYGAQAPYSLHHFAFALLVKKTPPVELIRCPHVFCLTRGFHRSFVISDWKSWQLHTHQSSGTTAHPSPCTFYCAPLHRKHEPSGFGLWSQPGFQKSRQLRVQEK